MVPQRRHSSVSLGNLTTTQNEKLQPSPLTIREHEEANSADYHREATNNSNIKTNNNNNNTSKMMFSNVTSIPIVLCGMLQSDIFGSNFAMGRENATISDETSQGDVTPQPYEHQRRQQRRAFFDTQHLGGGDDIESNNHDNHTGGQYYEGSA